jgi:hypothetical protein
VGVVFNCCFSWSKARKLKRGIGRMEFTSKVLVRKAMAEMGAMG